MKSAYGIKNAGIAGALTVAVLYILCAAAFAVAPGIMLEVSKSLFHGIQVNAAPISAARFAAGLVASLVVGAVIGIVFAVVCRYTCCREK